MPATEFLTRHVTLVKGQAQWGRFTKWISLEKAITHARKYLKRKHIGTIIYARAKGQEGMIPVYQAKWGSKGVPFESWKNNPVADMWKRKLDS